MPRTGGAEAATPPPPGAGRLNLMLSAAAGLAGLLLGAGGGFNPYDEPWFLQVLNRMAQGEVLYRDIFFGTTPLAAWMGLLAVKLAGTELLAVKTLEALCFGATVWLTLSAHRLLTGGGRIPWAALLALMVFARPGASGPGSLYVPLAAAAGLAAFHCFLRRFGPDRRGEWRWTALAGAAAGACFAAKYTVGLSVMAALTAGLAIGRGRDGGAGRPRYFAAAIALAAFTAVALAALAPVVLQGGMEKLWHYGLANKGSYLRQGSISYFDVLVTQIPGIGSSSPVESLRSLYTLALAALPLAAFGLLSAFWMARRRRGRQALSVLVFAAALATGAFPRPDSYHLSSISPAMLLVIGYAWAGLFAHRAAWRSLLGKTVLAVLLGGLAVLSARPVLRAASGRRVISVTRHFRGLPVDREGLRACRAAADSLALLAGNGGTFILSPRAGLYYLLGGMYNPTPYDYPVISALGQAGQKEVIGLIEGGEIAAVAFDQEAARDEFMLLEGFLRDRMDPDGRVGGLEIFRPRPTRGYNSKQ